MMNWMWHGKKIGSWCGRDMGIRRGIQSWIANPEMVTMVDKAIKMESLSSDKIKQIQRNETGIRTQEWERDIYG